MIIDARDTVLGRLASSVARELMKGEEVFVVNAEECVITGSKSSIIKKYKERVDRKSVVNPARHGPFFPKRPDGILKRTVRGMIPYKEPRGKSAFKNLKVYVGVPEELKDKELVTFDEFNISKLEVPKYIKLKELSNFLGARF